MSQQFVKGRTNNHLTWVMVDSTDFATPESALSAATKIKIYGKVRGATGVNFVSSGAGSLTNDIQHVGASALGIYTIALVKADLSDASAAWYDQYIISLSATGAAYQTLVVDGGIDASAMSALQSRVSDLQSYLVAMSGMLSDAHSAAILGASNASEAQSIALVIQSRLSDLDSRLASDLSDVVSGITALSGAVSDAHSAATAGASRALINQSRISDVQSYLVAMSDALSDAHSDLKSAIGGITVTLTASDISDIASATAAAVGSTISDIYSLLSDLNSNFLSRIPKEPAARSQLSDLSSDLLSYLTGLSAAVSDAHSAAILGASTASEAQSIALVIQSRLSDLDSRLTSDVSDVLSQLTVVQSMASDAHSAAVQGNSRALVNQSVVSDIYSLLSDLHSDVAVLSGVVSDVYSALAAGVDIGASSLSDLRSAITANGLQAAGADPTTVIGVTASYGAKLDWLAALSRNKVTQTATQQALYADNGTTSVASATVSDDGTTFTRAEWS